jgi:hypothetical protein
VFTVFFTIVGNAVTLSNMGSFVISLLYIIPYSLISELPFDIISPPDLNEDDVIKDISNVCIVGSPNAFDNDVVILFKLPYTMVLIAAFLQYALIDRWT